MLSFVTDSIGTCNKGVVLSSLEPAFTKVRDALWRQNATLSSLS